MSAAYKAVHARRARLVERAEIQREELADQLGTWQGRLGVVDQGLAAFRWLKRSAPVIGMSAGAVMAALAFIRPANISGWLEGGRAVWKVLTDRNLGAARNLVQVVKKARSDRSEASGPEEGPK